METKEQKEERLTKALNKLEASRIPNVQKLINRSYDELKELSTTYWEAYRTQEESNNMLSAEVIYKKYSIIKEAIRVKRGIEEEVWDCLT